MDKTKERFREMLNDIAERDGIKTFKKLAEMTGISQNTFTRIKRNEVKEVDIETFRKLNSVFGNRYNVLWFQGDSPYMLVKDYQSAQKQGETALPDLMSVFNAALARDDEAIAALKRESIKADEYIAELKQQIADLRSQLDDKDAIIAEKNQRLKDYRHIIDSHNLLDKIYSFGIGSAEQPNI